MFCSIIPSTLLACLTAANYIHVVCPSLALQLITNYNFQISLFINFLYLHCVHKTICMAIIVTQIHYSTLLGRVALRAQQPIVN